jgi:hypothetical protein
VLFCLAFTCLVLFFLILSWLAFILPDPVFSPFRFIQQDAETEKTLVRVRSSFWAVVEGLAFFLCLLLSAPSFFVLSYVFLSSLFCPLCFHVCRVLPDPVFPTCPRIYQDMQAKETLVCVRIGFRAVVEGLAFFLCLLLSSPIFCVLSCLALSCLSLSFVVSSCLVLSWHVLSCLLLSCLVLPCLSSSSSSLITSLSCDAIVRFIKS